MLKYPNPKLLSNVYMEVTPEQSIEIQRIVFSYGGHWRTAGRNIAHLTATTLFISSLGTLAYSQRKEKEVRGTEPISAQLFINYRGMKSPLPII